MTAATAMRSRARYIMARTEPQAPQPLSQATERRWSADTAGTELPARRRSRRKDEARPRLQGLVVWRCRPGHTRRPRFTARPCCPAAGRHRTEIRAICRHHATDAPQAVASTPMDKGGQRQTVIAGKFVRAAQFHHDLDKSPVSNDAEAEKTASRTTGIQDQPGHRNATELQRYRRSFQRVPEGKRVSPAPAHGTRRRRTKRTKPADGEAMPRAQRAYK